MSNTTQNKAFKFAAISQIVEEYIPKPTEKVASGSDMVMWGTDNLYPEYLLELCNEAPTLQTIVNGNVDYISGDDATIEPLREDFADKVVNLRGDTINEQVRAIAGDFEKYGAFALQIIRNYAGGIAEIYYIDIRFLRTNKDCNVFWYNEEWKKNKKKDAVIYPAFMPRLKWESLSDEERNRHASSILYVKNTHSQTYPSPLYRAAIKSCEMERQIDDFHLADLNNHFASSAVINFNNGIYDDEMKSQIERDVQEKHAGAKNGGRIMLSFNDSKETETTIAELHMEDFGERYKALASHSRQQIFSAFRAIPLLFGLTSEANTGFSTDEFEQSFKLYNRTQIRPVQRIICDAYDKIYGRAEVLTIKPFSLEGDAEKEVR